MAKCKGCGKSGLFLTLNSEKLCADCAKERQVEKDKQLQQKQLEKAIMSSRKYLEFKDFIEKKIDDILWIGDIYESDDAYWNCFRNFGKSVSVIFRSKPEQDFFRERRMNDEIRWEDNFALEHLLESNYRKVNDFDSRYCEKNFFVTNEDERVWKDAEIIAIESVVNQFIADSYSEILQEFSSVHMPEHYIAWIRKKPPNKKMALKEPY